MKIVSSNSRSAFTLVEIMVVVAIIGVLAAIAIPGFTSHREIAIKNTCLANIRQLDSALTTAALETGAFINNLSEDDIKAIIEPDYIRSMPHCRRGVYSTDDSGGVHCDVHAPSGGG
ncbi:MAG: prepilin-type N-terminal cleavage/methylation domain-containing protein [Candidatus Omnitrophica bacterium]|nr:prepilin-type N-terminal cleavage/methylation domain-containing protein [Candidatus Omnitrophota bacterium]